LALVIGSQLLLPQQPFLAAMLGPDVDFKASLVRKKLIATGILTGNVTESETSGHWKSYVVGRVMRYSFKYYGQIGKRDFDMS
jgi:hypothetical protein